MRMIKLNTSIINRLAAGGGLLTILISYKLFFGLTYLDRYPVFDAFRSLVIMKPILSGLLILVGVGILLNPRLYLLKLSWVLLYLSIVMVDLHCLTVSFVHFSFWLLIPPALSPRQLWMNISYSFFLLFVGMGIYLIAPHFRENVFPVLFGYEQGNLIWQGVCIVLAILSLCAGVFYLIPRYSTIAYIVSTIHLGGIFLLIFIGFLPLGLVPWLVVSLMILLLLHFHHFNALPKGNFELHGLIPGAVYSLLFILSLTGEIGSAFSFRVLGGNLPASFIIISEEAANRFPKDIKDKFMIQPGEGYVLDVGNYFLEQNNSEITPTFDGYFYAGKSLTKYCTSINDMVLFIVHGNSGGLGGGVFAFTLEDLNGDNIDLYANGQ